MYLEFDPKDCIKLAVMANLKGGGGNTEGLDVDPCTEVVDVWLCLHMGPPTTGAGTIPDSVACLLILFA